MEQQPRLSVFSLFKLIEPSGSHKLIRIISLGFNSVSNLVATLRCHSPIKSPAVRYLIIMFGYADTALSLQLKLFAIIFNS